MKKFSVLAIMAVVSLGIMFTSCNSGTSVGSAKLTSEVDSVSYILGKNTASGMKKQMTTDMEMWPEKGSLEAYIAGFMKGWENADDSVYLGKNLEETNTFVNGFFMRAQQKMADDNKAAGDKFLDENRTKSGVITTESGLQYKVITEGKGAKPAATDNVRVNYTGKLLDGTVFDSTEGRDPAAFNLGGGIIPGWREGVLLMPVGSKYILYIPVDLGYGMATPNSNVIPANSALEFEVELLEIVK